MIDWDKPIQTRDGRKARVICRDRGYGSSTQFKYVVLISDSHMVVQHSLNMWC
jgi:hypothetical protein